MHRFIETCHCAGVTCRGLPGLVKLLPLAPLRHSSRELFVVTTLQDWLRTITSSLPNSNPPLDRLKSWPGTFFFAFLYLNPFLHLSPSFGLQTEKKKTFPKWPRCFFPPLRAALQQTPQQQQTQVRQGALRRLQEELSPASSSSAQRVAGKGTKKKNVKKTPRNG